MGAVVDVSVGGSVGEMNRGASEAVTGFNLGADVDVTVIYQCNHWTSGQTLWDKFLHAPHGII